MVAFDRADDGVLGINNMAYGTAINAVQSYLESALPADVGSHHGLLVARDYGIRPSNTAAANNAGFTALLAAIAAGTGRGVLFTEPGTVQFSSTVTWPVSSYNLDIAGRSLDTILHYTTADGTDAWVFDGMVASNTQLTIRNLRLKGGGAYNNAGGTANTGNGIKLRNRTDVLLLGVWVTDFGNGAGILGDGLELATIVGGEAKRCKYGLHLKQAVGGIALGSNANTVVGWACNDLSIGIRLESCGVFTMRGNAVQGCYNNGVEIVGGEGIGFDGVYFEATNVNNNAGGGAVVTSGVVKNLALKSCHFGTDKDNVVIAASASRATLENCEAYNVTNAGDYTHILRTSVVALTDTGFATTRNHPAFFYGSATWDPASLGNGAFAVQDITCTGALVGYPATVAVANGLPNGVIAIANCQSANSVRVTLVNLSGSTQDLASGTYRVVAMGREVL